MLIVTGGHRQLLSLHPAPQLLKPIRQEFVHLAASSLRVPGLGLMQTSGPRSVQKRARRQGFEPPWRQGHPLISLALGVCSELARRMPCPRGPTAGGDRPLGIVSSVHP